MASIVWIAYCMDCDTQLTENEGRREECPNCKESDE
jgi:exosome complex RNA-binding protein Csl4